MITVGTPSPDFVLEDQFGAHFRLLECAGRRNTLLLFYPLDWTPTCSGEVPALDAMADRFLREANTRVAAISVDSRYSHAEWCSKFGGVSIPVLADFDPKGLVATALGVYLPERGTTDRATIIVGADGLVKYSYSVGVDGRRDMNELLAIAKQFGGPGQPARVPNVAVGPIYIRNGCFFSDRVLSCIRNLHAERMVAVKNVSTDPVARAELVAMFSAQDPSVPAAVIDGALVIGSDAVCRALAEALRGSCI